MSVLFSNSLWCHALLSAQELGLFSPDATFPCHSLDLPRASPHPVSSVRVGDSPPCTPVENIGVKDIRLFLWPTEIRNQTTHLPTQSQPGPQPSFQGVQSLSCPSLISSPQTSQSALLTSQDTAHANPSSPNALLPTYPFENSHFSLCVKASPDILKCLLASNLAPIHPLSTWQPGDWRKTWGGASTSGKMENLGSISGWGRSPGEGSGNPLQYSFLDNPMDRGAWWAAVHGIAKSRTWLSN